MKSTALLNLLLFGALSSACGDHHTHDDKEWTKEDLEELEAKWGQEVSTDCCNLCFLSFFSLLTL